MSFWPLATSLVDRLRSDGPQSPLIELGCGEGDFARRLRSLGFSTLGIDVDAVAAKPDLCADVLHLPFRAHSLGGFVAGNLLRHLRPEQRGTVAAETARCARPGAFLLVCEDSPVGRGESERNYREALQLLAAFDARRGPPLSIAELDAQLRPHWPRLIDSNACENEERVRDPAAPLRWLLGQPRLAVQLRTRCEELAERVARSGMSYGLYEYALYQVPS